MGLGRLELSKYKLNEVINQHRPNPARHCLNRLFCASVWFYNNPLRSYFCGFADKGEKIIPIFSIFLWNEENIKAL